MTLLDWLHLLAWFFFFWGLITVSQKARHRREKRAEESVIDEVNARLFEAWNDEDRHSPLLSLQDLTPYVGEVLPKAVAVVDELGEWFPERHATVPPHLYVGLSYVFPVSRGYDENPWWLSSTGAWKTVQPKQLEASSS